MKSKTNQDAKIIKSYNDKTRHFQSELTYQRFKFKRTNTKYQLLIFLKKANKSDTELNSVFK